MRTLAVVYGSQTGGAQEAAEGLARRGRRRGFTVRVVPMDAYPIAELPDERFVLYVASTTGDGEAPDNMAQFWRFMLRKSLPADVLAEQSFAVLGLGDSSYPKYNAAARRLRSRLLQLGARELCALGLADDQSPRGPENDVGTWSQAFWAAAMSAFPPPAGFVLDDSPTALRPSFALQRVEGGGSPRGAADRAAASFYAPPPGTYPACGQAPIRGVIAANRRLTADTWSQDVRHIEIEIGDATRAGLRYRAGDVAVVYGKNVLIDCGGAAAVAQLLALPGGAAARYRVVDRVVDAAATATAAAAATARDEVVPPPAWLPQECSLEELLTSYLDVLATPRRYFFEQLSFFASDEEEREKLVELGVASALDKDAAALLNEYCTREKRTYVDFTLSSSGGPYSHTLYAPFFFLTI